MSDRIIVFGSRNWLDAAYLWRQLDLLSRNAVIVHGACPTGADAFAEQYALACGLAVERYPANWRAYGRSAGPRRNEAMATLGATFAIGFRMPGDSRGTDHMRGACERHGIPVERHGWGWA